MSSRICGHIPHPCYKLSMSQIAATTGATSHTATESGSFPIQDMLTSTMPSLFLNGETSPPGQNINPGKTWQVGKLWLKSRLQKAFNAWVAETSDYSTCCYLRYEHNVGLRQRRADFQSIHSRNRFEVTVI